MPVSANEPQPVFEVRSRVTFRSLMNRSKADLAHRVLELMDLLDRERRLREAAEERHESLEP